MFGHELLRIHDLFKLFAKYVEIQRGFVTTGGEIAHLWIRKSDGIYDDEYFQVEEEKWKKSRVERKIERKEMGKSGGDEEDLRTGSKRNRTRQDQDIEGRESSYDLGYRM